MEVLRGKHVHANPPQQEIQKEHPLFFVGKILLILFLVVVFAALRQRFNFRQQLKQERKLHRHMAARRRVEERLRRLQAASIERAGASCDEPAHIS